MSVFAPAVPRREGNGTGWIPKWLGLSATSLLIVAAATRPAYAPDATAGAPAAVREGYERASNELLCYCGCARQTIQDCTCGVAFELRDEFEQRLASGETAEAIIASYIAEHGEQSRNVPPKSGINLIAWFGPGIGIVLGGIVVALVLRSWVRRERQAPLPSPSPASPEGEELRRRVEKELQEFDA